MCMYTCVHTSISVCVYVHIHAYVCVCVCECVNVCMCVSCRCACVYTCVSLSKQESPICPQKSPENPQNRRIFPQKPYMSANACVHAFVSRILKIIGLFCKRTL